MLVLAAAALAASAPNPAPAAAAPKAQARALLRIISSATIKFGAPKTGDLPAERERTLNLNGAPTRVHLVEFQ
jgi:hypothetical protein